MFNRRGNLNLITELIKETIKSIRRRGSFMMKIKSLFLFHSLADLTNITPNCHVICKKRNMVPKEWNKLDLKSSKLSCTVC